MNVRVGARRGEARRGRWVGGPTGARARASLPLLPACILVHDVVHRTHRSGDSETRTWVEGAYTQFVW